MRVLLTRASKSREIVPLKNANLEATRRSRSGGFMNIVVQVSGVELALAKPLGDGIDLLGHLHNLILLKPHEMCHL